MCLLFCAMKYHCSMSLHPTLHSLGLLLPQPDSAGLRGPPSPCTDSRSLWILHGAQLWPCTVHYSSGRARLTPSGPGDRPILAAVGTPDWLAAAGVLWPMDSGTAPKPYRADRGLSERRRGRFQRHLICHRRRASHPLQLINRPRLLPT